MKYLIIGDSLSLTTYPTPGYLLGKFLEARGAAVRINARGGRSAHTFFTMDNGAAVLANEARRNPDVVIVMLGTNDVGYPNAAQMQRIKDAFPKASVWGIGPPTLPKSPQGAEKIVAMMRGIFPQFVDWRPLTADMISTSTGRSPDLVHFSQAGAATAAKRLDAALAARMAGVPAVVKAIAGALVVSFTGLLVYALATRKK